MFKYVCNLLNCLLKCVYGVLHVFQAEEDAQAFSLAEHDALPLEDAHHQLHLSHGRLLDQHGQHDQHDQHDQHVLIGVPVFKVSQI